MAENISSDLFKMILGRNLKGFCKLRARVADFNTPREFDGKSPLQFAMEFRADDIALAMIEAGAALGPRELNLIWAVLIRRPDIVKKFIQGGADPNIDTMMGTPLSIAASPPRSMLPGPEEALGEIIQLLIAAGADVNVGRTTGTPLQHAMVKNRTAAALLLIRAGAKVRMCPLDSLDPLMNAIRNGNLEVAQALVEAGLDITERIKDGVDPLELAKSLKDKKMIALLTNAAANPPSRKPPAPKSAKPTTQLPGKKAKKSSAKLASPSGADNYQDAVAQLETLCGTRAHPLDKSRPEVSLHLDSRRPFDLEKVQTDFLKKGFFVFATNTESSRIAILQTADKYDALTAMATNGTNHDLAPKDIVAWLRQLEKEQPFVLTGVGFDFLKGKFTSKLLKPAALAERMYKFCPDIVDQGAGTVKELTAELRRTQEFFFWWD